MKRRDEFRIVAVIKPSGDGALDGGSSAVDSRMVATACRRAESEKGEKRRKGGAK